MVRNEHFQLPFPECSLTPGSGGLKAHLNASVLRADPCQLLNLLLNQPSPSPCVDSDFSQQGTDVGRSKFSHGVPWQPHLGTCVHPLMSRSPGPSWEIKKKRPSKRRGTGGEQGGSLREILFTYLKLIFLLPFLYPHPHPVTSINPPTRFYNAGFMSGAHSVCGRYYKTCTGAK